MYVELRDKRGKPFGIIGLAEDGRIVADRAGSRFFRPWYADFEPVEPSAGLGFLKALAGWSNGYGSFSEILPGPVPLNPSERVFPP